MDKGGLNFNLSQIKARVIETLGKFSKGNVSKMRERAIKAANKVSLSQSDFQASKPFTQLTACSRINSQIRRKKTSRSNS